MRLVVVSVVGLGCSAMLGCVTASSAKAETAAPQGPTASDFYPLQVGSEWKYEVDFFSEKKTISVRTVRKVDGFVEDSTGARFLVDGYGVRDQRRYLLRNPVEPGTKWSSVVTVSSVEHYEILATDQPCDAPAGSWTGCVVVQSKNRVEEGVTLMNETTFAPGVGIVRVATTLERQGKRVPQATLRLLAYVKSPPTPTPTPAAP